MIPSNEKIVVGFAGGGGSCEGIRLALGRDPDVAINHDAEAIAMHVANFPGTRHYQNNIWRVDPGDVVRDLGGAPIGFAWFSPDCKHFSKAKGGKPLEKSIRDLAWVVCLWAKRARSRIIVVENVEEFQDWGPLLDDGRPCGVQRGFTFRLWVKELKRNGYRVEWRELRACDYGAPTIRKRLFVIARRDGLPIVWPAPTHGAGLIPFRTAAECIDWTIDCPSIFLTKEEGRAIGVKRPLVDNTMARIAKGTWRYVINAAKPFIIPITHAGDTRCHPVDQPARTITCAPRGEQALVVPFMSGCGGRAAQSPPKTCDTPLNTATAKADQILVCPHIMTMRNAQKPHSAADEPTHTITAGGAHLNLVSAFLAQHNTGMVGHPPDAPVSTITQRGTQQQVVSAFLSHAYNSGGAQATDMDEPMRTVTAGGFHAAEVRAFLIKYYGSAQGQDIVDPLHSATAKARFGLVTVAGQDYQIVDIGMRMLTPRELFRAQGFPDSYVIDFEFDGKPLSKTAQIQKAGNSVCPPVAAAIFAANYIAAAPAYAESAE